MGCVHSRSQRKIIRTNSGHPINREIHTVRKFRSGLHVEKTSEMGAEANFQAGFATDVSEKYTRANGNKIPKISELVSIETQTAPQLSLKKKNNIENEPIWEEVKKEFEK